MRIAQIAPVTESVPPRLYGGTERVVSVLTEELVRRGHEVTLFASGDSNTSAELVSCVSQGLRLDPKPLDYVACTTVQLGRVFESAQPFDIIHNHVDYLAFPLARLSATPMVTTTHGRLDYPEAQVVFRYFAEAALVSISNHQRRPLRDAHWVATIYNGIELESFQLRKEPGTYLAFLGRLSPEKRADRAIEVARELDMPLKIAAKIDDSDKDYFEHAIRPYLDNSLIEYVGEVNESEKDEFLGNAFAYLFPIDWPEPFGLTMVEAMACGTPVVAMKAGSVAEVVENGVSGFVCKNFREFIDCVAKVEELDRGECRLYAESRFSPAAMADAYEGAYAKVVESRGNTAA